MVPDQLLTWLIAERDDAATLVGLVMHRIAHGELYAGACRRGVGYSCKVGMLTRPMRVILLGIDSLSLWLVPVLGILAVLTWVTSIQRIVHVYRESKLNP